jgi:hypothetical protein
MKLFPQDSGVVLYETGFENDILDRSVVSKKLSELLETIENPLVISLDDKWGSGKTYFLKRWVTAHSTENGGKAVTVYFDAFESDYLSDPLVAIITAVSSRIPEKEQSTVRKWKAVASKLAKPAFGLALSIATFGAKHYLDEIGDAIADATSAEARDAADHLWDAERDRKDTVDMFRKLLAELTESTAAPIVIVVDELDRCRPDYALSILEVIKHFFNVPKVHFVLGVNGDALENSVRARYGADIDAEGYLRKFINVSFSLPRMVGPLGDQNVVARYASNLASEMKLPDFLAPRCINLLSCVSKVNNVSLRDVGKILSKVALVPGDVSNYTRLSGWIDTLCILIVASVIDPKLHRRLSTAKASEDEIRDFLGAFRNLTIEKIDDKRNADFSHELSIWLAHALFSCSAVNVAETKDLPSWKERIATHFESFGTHYEPKKISATIQREWVEIFKL